MANLNTITAQINDKVGKPVPNLSVKTRYVGSTRESEVKTTQSQGVFVFQASPNRNIEILAKPPNEKEFTVIKTVSSSASKVTVNLPKTIEEYEQGNTKIGKGIVSNHFKVVDKNGKVLKNFPIQTRPKGKNAYTRYSDVNGIVQVDSSPNRDVEILILTSKDEFKQKYAFNSGMGSKQIRIIQLDEPYVRYKSQTKLKIVDRQGNDYNVGNTSFEMLIVETGEKKNYNFSNNAEITLTSKVGQELKLTVLKPDGKRLETVSYIAKRINEKPVKLKLDVDVTNGKTAEDKPTTDKDIDENILITMAQMKKMWPNASAEKMQPILDELNSDLMGYKLDTRLRQAHFMAQVRQEVGPSFSLREQVEYMGPNALKQIGYYRTHPKQADIDGYKRGKGPANGEVIANRMYDDKYRSARYKLGNTSPGDGWKYLGRGLKQLTGKSNYKDLTDMYATIWPDENVDFVKNPELIEQPKYAVRSAIRFWLKYKLYEIADKGATGAQVDAITRVINEATDSYDARRRHFTQAYKIFI